MIHASRDWPFFSHGSLSRSCLTVATAAISIEKVSACCQRRGLLESVRFATHFRVRAGRTVIAPQALHEGLSIFDHPALVVETSRCITINKS